MMTTNSATHPVQAGDVRPNQLMFTYGVGAIIDLPYLSTLVLGIDAWTMDPDIVREITEERLLEAVRWELGTQVRQLLSPPVVRESGGRPNPFDRSQQRGVPVASFPRWMLCPRCRRLAPLSTGLFELKDFLFHPERTKYVHVNCCKSKTPPPVVPARFLAACEKGHLDDFPWIEFVHGGPTDCRASLRQLEWGTSGEARDLQVVCDTCGKTRSMADAFGRPGELSMPQCRGRRPHLRDFDPNGCDKQVKAILLGASNLWFPDVLVSMGLPTGSPRLRQLVGEKWGMLRHVSDQAQLALLRDIGQLAGLEGYSNDELWGAIQDKRAQEETGDAVTQIDLKMPEWLMFSNPGSAPISDDFRLREVAVPDGFESNIDKVVLVERLREVRALVGFTLIDPPSEFGELLVTDEDRRMQISRRPPLWVPATEVRGEGIFIQFREDAIRDWLARGAVQNWDVLFRDSHRLWREARGFDMPEANYPGLRFVLLHSFAHVLMRQLILECGYNSASLRERIYSRNPEDADDGEPMAGVLIYTSAPDSEGTLGGLVSLGEPASLGRHMRNALRSAGLCTSDPLCAEHQPSRRGDTLHAAACHACMFAPETSCERGNRYLDRSLLVPTLERADLAFSEGWD